jgi:hypothetical protein
MLTTKADRLDAEAAMWEKGELGERAVGAQLDRLVPLGWQVLHDVRWPGRPRANIDHVAVGPGGILVVDAKNWSGRVAARGGRLRQNGFIRDREVAAVAAAGEAVSERLDLPFALHVIPVLCVSGGFGSVTRLGATTVLGAPDLVTWARGLDAHLQPGDVEAITLRLRMALPPAGSPLPRTHPSRQRRRARGSAEGPALGRRRRSVVQRRRQPAPALLGRLALLLAVVLAAPSLLSWWGESGPGLVQQVMPAPTVSPSVPAPVIFSGCRALRRVHPSGVAQPGAVNAGWKVFGVPTVDRGTAAANATLDRDRDGMVCEVKGAKRLR